MRLRRGANRAAEGLVGLIALVGLFVLAVTPAAAGIGGSDVPTWPVSATVGDIINVSITIVNGSTTPNDTEGVIVDNFAVNPACKSSANAICLGGNVDPGVFHTLVGGQGIGGAGTACPGTVFDISPPFPDGGLVLTPQTTVTLGSTASGVNLTCTVNFSLRVFKMPANPTTFALTGVQLHGANSGLQGLGTGSAQITIAKATPAVTTTSNPNAGSVVPGTAVSDTVTVTKAPGAILPTGSVRFILCQPGDVTATGCASPAGAVVPPDVALSAVPPISATSNTTTNTLAIGTYCWRARYLGDANYNAVNHTDAVAECFTTVKQPPTIATLSNPTGGNVTPGTAVTDTVTVTGGAGLPTPTGTVTWFLCQPGEVTANGGDCSANGTQIGPVKTLNPNGIRVSGGTINTATTGKYCWRVAYSGDSFYSPLSHTDAVSECFTVVKQSLTVTTLSSPTGSGVATGTSVTDQVTVAGAAGQSTPTGSVTFFLCQPADVTAGGCESPAGALVGSAKTLDGSGQATSDASNNTNTAGKYCWRAEYSGDLVYNPASHTDATNECFTTEAITALCKTPGYWGNHPAITQLVLEQAMAKVGGPLTICGETIDTTAVPDQQSAIEAICAKPSDDSLNPLKGGRNLMVTALNCAVTDPSGSPTTVCDNAAINDLFEACNTECAAVRGTGTAVVVTLNNVEIDCNAALDCYNNGKGFDPASGLCSGLADSACLHATSVIGTCSGSGDLCSNNHSCPQGETCDEQSADPDSCQEARGNSCTIFGGTC